MIELIEKITRKGTPVTREELRRASAEAKPGRPKAFMFNFRPQSKAFNLSLRFRKSKVNKGEIIHALEEIIESLRK